jgi:hypothetical protein
MGALKDPVTVFPKGLCTAALHSPEAALGVTAQCISAVQGPVAGLGIPVQAFQ